MKLGNRLHRILYERGMTGSEFAEICGLDPSQLNRIKNGRAVPTVITALRIARAIGLEVEEVFEPPASCRVPPLGQEREAAEHAQPTEPPPPERNVKFAAARGGEGRASSCRGAGEPAGSGALVPARRGARS